MLEIRVNNESFKKVDDNNITLDDIYNLFETSGEHRKQVITSIVFDGKTLSFDEEEIYRNKSLSSFNKIDLTAKSSVELAFDAIDSCSSYLDVVIGKIDVLGELFSKNKIDEANHLFIETIEIMDLFVQLISKINNALKTELKDKYRKTDDIQKLEIHLLSIMKALLPAKERNDIIMLCDLLEYELKDNLIQWKIKVIPEMKKMKDSI